MKLTPLVIILLLVYGAGNAQKLGCTLPPGQFAHYSLRTSFFDTGYQRNVMYDTHWDNGSTIRVKFLSGSRRLQEWVKIHAKAWEMYANIKFDFVTEGVGDIRIHLGNEGYHYSYDGSSSNLARNEEPTMVLDTSDLGTSMSAWQAVVRHQFGHALGLKHEHQPPVSAVKWNKEEMYKHYGKIGYDKEGVDKLIGILNQSSSNGFYYDHKSIMSNPIPSSQTMDGYNIVWTKDLSENDKKIISSIYPKHGQRTDQIHSTMLNKTVDMTVMQNNNKAGLSFFPSIKIQSAKSSRLYVCVLLYDEDGYSLRDDDGNYAFGKTVAAGRSINSVGNEMLLTNSKSLTDFELFIPFSQIPEIDQKENIRLRLIVVEVDPNGDKKVLHQTETVSYQLNKKSASTEVIPTQVSFPAVAKS